MNALSWRLDWLCLSITHVIYDQEAYDESFLLYPDDPNKDKLHVPKYKKHYKKQKKEAHYNWIVKLEKPLGRLPDVAS